MKSSSSYHILYSPLGLYFTLEYAPEKVFSHTWNRWSDTNSNFIHLAGCEYRPDHASFEPKNKEHFLILLTCEPFLTRFLKHKANVLWLNFLLFGPVITVNECPVMEIGLFGCPVRALHTAVAVSRPKLMKWAHTRREWSCFISSPLIMLLWRRILAIRAWRIGRRLSLALRCWSGKESREQSSRLSRNRSQTRSKHWNKTPRKSVSIW
jgi:hypothetical protein